MKMMLGALIVTGGALLPGAVFVLCGFQGPTAVLGSGLIAGWLMFMLGASD